MDSPRSSKSIFIHLFITFFIINTIKASPSSTVKKFSKIYAFGDSYTDTGNFKPPLPNGITYFHRRSDRLSDGRLVIDFISQSLSLPLLPPYRDLNHSSAAPAAAGVNFAVSGSTAIDRRFYEERNITAGIGFAPSSVGAQLGWFKDFMAARRAEEMGGALFWVGEIGANDYAYTFGRDVSPDTVKELAVKSVANVVQELLRLGGKHIVVQGIHTIGCLPLSLILAPSTSDRDDIGCVASANHQAYSHNALLQAKLQQLRKQFPQALISYADHWNAYRAVMKNPTKYGFMEPFKACCGSGKGAYNFDLSEFCGSSPASNKPCSTPSHFISWDGVHLTEAMYKVVADMFVNQGYCHPSFQ
ncbi:hypothetical protein Scep_021084 [Stephania cephalantha]|uniref:Uncharacterized protein n=1 Tax=Stephania cephalantha TaxID=152367 RepID=A0AAP0F5H4_9MAGN